MIESRIIEYILKHNINEYSKIGEIVALGGEISPALLAAIKKTVIDFKNYSFDIETVEEIIVEE
jgi:hypothetical protein